MRAKYTSMFGFVLNKNDYRQVRSVDKNNIESISYLLENRCLDEKMKPRN